MDGSLIETVRLRAGRVCEYCQLPEEVHPGSFEIEHIVPRQHGGATELANLAWACLRCNRHKGTNLVGLDRAGTRTKLTPLVHPRRHKWDRHFRWDGPFLVGRTAVGRVTVQVLAMNEPMRVALRRALLAEGLFP